jgi:RNase P/RNase MRP subunit p30
MSEAITIPILISITGIVITGVSFLYTRFKTTSEIESRLTAIETKLDNKKDYIDDIRSVCERVKALEVKNELVWGAIEKAVIDILHHPNQKEKDALLEKFRDKDITEIELEQLDNLLRCDLTERRGTSESVAAALLIARIKQFLYDYQNKTLKLNK